MKILGIDTTTKVLSIGIGDGSKVYEYNLEVGRNLSSLIVVTIKRIIDTLGWKARDIDYLSCGIGPGSFTGVRVGLSVIKGLGWSLNKPVIGVPTLDILAANAQAGDRYIVPAVDAKRNLIYASVYRNKNGKLIRIRPYMLLSEGDFLKEVKSNAVVLGDALNIYKDKISKNIKEVNILDKDCWYPKGHNIITLTLEKIRLKKFDNAFDIEPIYLYPKECQIKNPCLSGRQEISKCKNQR